MFLLGGICFIYLGLINEVLPWSMPLGSRSIGAIGITHLGICHWLHRKFVARLGSLGSIAGFQANLLGQICPQYFVLWLPVALAGIVLDDWIRYRKFGEERPHYRLI